MSKPLIFFGQLFAAMLIMWGAASYDMNASDNSEAGMKLVFGFVIILVCGAAWRKRRKQDTHKEQNVTVSNAPTTEQLDKMIELERLKALNRQKTPPALPKRR